MKYTQLIRLIFSNTDGTAYVNFTDIFFPVKSIVVSNAFYSTTTPQQLNPTLVMGIETNIFSNHKPIVIVPINGDKPCDTVINFEIPTNITVNKIFWVKNMNTGFYGPFANTDTCSMIMEFSD